MKQTTMKWAAMAVLASAAVYLGTLVSTAQQDAKPDPNTEKLDKALKQLEAVSTKLDEMSKKIDAIQEEVHFIKVRGKG